MMMMTSHQLIKTFSPNFVLFVAQTIYDRTARAKFVVSLKTKKIYICKDDGALCVLNIYTAQIHWITFPNTFFKTLVCGCLSLSMPLGYT